MSSGYKLTVTVLSENQIEVRYLPVDPGKEGFHHTKTTLLNMTYAEFVSAIESIASERQVQDVSNG